MALSPASIHMLRGIAPQRPSAPAMATASMTPAQRLAVTLAVQKRNTASPVGPTSFHPHGTSLGSELRGIWNTIRHPSRQTIATAAMFAPGVKGDRVPESPFMMRASDVSKLSPTARLGTVFHGTDFNSAQAALKSGHLRAGSDPEMGGPPMTWTTTDPAYAREYAMRAAEQTGGLPTILGFPKGMLPENAQYHPPFGTSGGMDAYSTKGDVPLRGTPQTDAMNAQARLARNLAKARARMAAQPRNVLDMKLPSGTSVRDMTSNIGRGRLTPEQFNAANRRGTPPSLSERNAANYQGPRFIPKRGQ